MTAPLQQALRGARRLAPLLLVAAGVACESPTMVRPEFAFDPTALSRGLVYRWENGRTLRVWASGADSLQTTELRRAVDAAIDGWNDVPTFREYRLTQTTDSTNAEILVYDRARPIPIVPASCTFDPGGGKGYTYFCQAGTAPTTAERFTLASGTRSAASVLLRVDRAAASTGGVYQAIVAHELGHALGIGGHSDDARDLMFGSPAVLRPSYRDIATLQYVLGLRPDIRL